MRFVTKCAAWRAAAASIVILISGCGTTKVTGTARTATEQLLLTNAWDDALQKVDFQQLTGVPVFFDPQYLVSTVDQGWLVSSIRQAMLAQGVLLRPKIEQAQWVVEARLGAYGTNDSNFLIGIPQTTIPSVAGIPGGTLPEMPLAKKSTQQGIVKLALYAYDRASGQVTWVSGTQLATSNAKDVYIGGLGPIRSGSVYRTPEFIGVPLPTINGEAAPIAPNQEPVLPPSQLALPTDRELFAPP